MVLKLKLGTVMSKTDMTNTGMFDVAFDLQKNGQPQAEPVKYVSPYGSAEAAFIAIPDPGSQVLCVYDTDPDEPDSSIRGYYYLGSVMGVIPGLNNAVSTGNEESPDTPPETPYQDKTKEGLHGPASKEGDTPLLLQKDIHPFPERFQDMYEGKGVLPERIGLTNYRGDALMISNRFKGNKDPNSFQNHYVGMMSGDGKRIECIDSPIVNGIVMTNEHKGKDYLIWSSGMSEKSPFTEGEYHLRTHGPIRQYTLADRIHLWVEEGLNFDVENRATGALSPADPATRNNPDGRTPTDPQTKQPTGPPTGLKDKSGTGLRERIKERGDETQGCINIISRHNNISLSALEVDSLITLYAPGENTKVIIDTGGTVDIQAKKKITLQSDTEIEINAPIVDINGSDTVFIDGGPNIHLNKPHTGDPK